ncbi:MAG: DedA family protein [Caulobacteraceae bacterium]|jgi:membrane protein YqaA with SNARE-associated domain|nr:DedA family protein [Caulobacteraceae bacterium]
MLRPLYDWAMRLAAGRYALPALAGIAMVEATFPFVPPDVMLGPMVLARRERAWLYATVCTLASVAGGCVGYAFGYFASDAAVHLLAMTGRSGGLEAFQALFAKVGLAVILIKGLTPVPYMIVTLASGLAHFSLPVFIAASLATRGGRFFLVSALLQHPQAKTFVDRHLTALAVGAVVLLVAALGAVSLLEHHQG